MDINEAQVPTTKTGILTQLSDWGLDNKYITLAKSMDYGTLKTHVGGGKDAAVAAFDKSFENAQNVKDAEIINKDGSGQVSEAFDGVLDGLELTEETKSKVSTLFEAAVNLAVSEQVKAIEEEAVTEIEARVNEKVENITDKLDEYLDLVVNQWLEENKLAVENGIKLELAESFLGQFKNLLETHYIDMPAEKEDLFEAAVAEKETLQQEHNKQIEENVKLVKEIKDLKKSAIFAEMTEGLSSLQVDKFKTLTESFDFSNEDDFRGKLKQVKESFFNGSSKPEAKPLNEEKTTPKAPVNNLMTGLLGPSRK